jgi:hypothetical protein
MPTMDYRDYDNMSVELLAPIRADALHRVNIVTQSLKKAVRDEYATGTDIKKLSRKAGVTRRTIYAWLAE